ncbi:MAG: hypothetical protein DSM106950_02260 [Stigonema ocellatum SAG 48.90 = DSM 106950]|nr:hypothetical protein [Stigonema ocellatum SAG 48.90 = DSM 106950]
MQDSETVKFVESMTREYGTSDRTFKSAIIWAIADSDTQLREETRKLLAWEDIRDEERERLDDSQKRQLDENLKKAERDLKESVWRSYKNIALLGKDNKIRTVDLGMVTSSMARTMVELIINRLRQDGDVEDSISPRFIVRNWSPAFTEWSTKAVRDAFFASPLFPRLLNGDGVKEAIARGVRDGILAYVGKTSSGNYEPFQYQCTISAADIEISDDVFIITQETASAYKKAESAQDADMQTPSSQTQTGEITTNTPATTVSVTSFTTNVAKDKTTPYVKHIATEATEIITPPPSARVLKWSGAITPQKWMNFYTRVLSKFAANKDLKLTIKVSISVEGDVSTQKIEETKVALQELGLHGDIEME